MPASTGLSRTPWSVLAPHPVGGYIGHEVSDPQSVNRRMGFSLRHQLGLNLQFRPCATERGFVARAFLRKTAADWLAIATFWLQKSPIWRS
jgi:hypothetical protein